MKNQLDLEIEPKSKFTNKQYSDRRNLKFYRIRLLKNVALVSIAFILVIFQNSLAQTSWIGGTDTKWRTAANWTSGVPDDLTDAIIGDGSYTGPNFPTISRRAVCKSLTIGNSGTAVTLTITSGFTIHGNMLLGTDGALSHTNRTIDIKGDWTNNGSFSSSNKVQFSGIGIQTIGGSSATTFEDMRVTFSSITTLGSNLDVNNELVIRNGVFDPANFTVSGAGVIILRLAAQLLVKAATFTNNYAHSGGTTFGSNSNIIDYAATSIDQTIDDSFQYRILRISGGMTKSLAANTTIKRDLLVDAGTLDLLTFTANRSSGGGLISVANGATLRIGGTNTFPSNYTTHTLLPTSTVDYYGGDQSVSLESYGNLTMSGAGGAVTKTMPGANMTVAGNLTTSASAGTMSFTAGGNMAVLGNTTLGASTTYNGSTFSHIAQSDWTNNGTFNSSAGGAISFDGAGAALSGSGSSNFQDVTVAGNGVAIGLNTSVTISGDLNTTGGGSFNHATGGSGIITMDGTNNSISGVDIVFDDLTIGSSATIGSSDSYEIGGDLVVDGTLNSTTTSAVTFSGTSKTISGSGSIQFRTLEATGSVSTANSLTIEVDFSVAGSYSASAGVTTFDGTSTFSGTAQLADVTINDTRSLTMGNDAVLKISGTDLFNGSGSLDATTNIPNNVEYNSTGAQTPAVTSFNNLTFSGGNTKTAPSSLALTGDLIIGSSTTFAPGVFTHILEGNWTNNGTYSAGTSTIEMDGSEDVSITGATTFNNLTINKGSANVITVASDITVATLAMTSGNIDTGSNTATITTNRTGTGIIIGTITRTHSFSISTNYEFEGPNNYINFSDVGTVSSVTITVDPSPILTFPSGESVNREYEISITGTGYTGDLRLHYEQIELNGNAEAGLTLWNDAGTSTWTVLGNTSNDVNDDWVELTGITDLLNKWTLSDGINVHSWDGSNGTSWTDPLNWSEGSVPAITDVVQIGDLSFSNQPQITNNAQVKGITFGSVTAATLTIASGSLTVQGNIDGVWAADATHTFAIGSRTLTVFSDVILSAGTANRAIDLTISTGTVNISGDLVQTGGSAVTFSGAGTINIGEDYTYASGTFTPSTGMIAYNGITDQQVAGLAYNNLAIDKFSGAAIVGSPITINGDLQLSTGGELTVNADLTVSGDLTVDASTTLRGGLGAISVGGSWTLNGTFLPESGSVMFNGTGAQNIDITNFNDFEVNKVSGTATLLGDLTINGDVTVTAGDLDAGSFNLTRSVVGGVATLGPSSSIEFTGTSLQLLNFETILIDASNTATFGGTGVQSITGAVYGNMVISNGGANAKTISGTTVVQGDLTVNTGATLVAPNTSLFLQGDLDVDGTFDNNDGTIILDGTAKTLDGTITFNNLIVNGEYNYLTGGATFDSLLHVTATGDMDFAGATVVSNGDYTNEGTTTSSGTVTFSGSREQTLRLLNAVSSTSTGVINFNGTVAPLFNSNSSPSFATVNLNNTAGLTASQPWMVGIALNIATGVTWNAGAFDHVIEGNLTNSGTMTSSGKIYFNSIYFPTTLNLGSFTSTGEVEFGGTQSMTLVHNAQSFGTVTISNTHANGITPATNNWTIANDLQIASGALFNGGTGLAHTISGQWSNNGTFDGQTSTIIFNSSTAIDEITGSGTSTFNNLTLAVGADIDATSTFALTGNFTNNSTSFDLSGAEVTFSGSDLSVLGGSTNTSFQSLTLNKSANGLRIDLDATVTNLLDLVDGQLDLNGNTMAITNPLAAAITRTSGYILSENTSNLSRVDWAIGTDFDPHVFPFGTAGADYIPFTFDLSSGDAGTVSLATFPTAANNTPFAPTVTEMNDASGNDNSANTVDRFFQIDLSGQTTPNADITLVATAAEVGSIATLQGQRWSGSSWDDPIVGQTSGATSVTVPNVTQFSPWAMSGNSSPLPIELLSFDAKVTNNQVVLNWVTAWEQDNELFEIYKSTDGEFFDKIATMAGAGNSSEQLEYFFVDKKATMGISYYRLRQVDLDGSGSVSPVVSVLYNPGIQKMELYPNPSTAENGKLAIAGFEGNEIYIEVTDLMGKRHLAKQYLVESNFERLTMEYSIQPNPGVYVLTVRAKEVVYSQRFMVR